MITVRQIERLWNAKSYNRLFRDLVIARPEGSLRAQLGLAQPAGTAAMGCIRLFELNQEYTAMYGTLLRQVLAAQQSDGGWGDPLTTALAMRALLQNNGTGLAIAAGVKYLATLQKSEGVWPDGPLRRLPADAYVSAFIVYQLAEHAEFRAGVRFLEAVSWFESNEASLDPESRSLWDRAAARCRLHQECEADLWSIPDGVEIK